MRFERDALTNYERNKVSSIVHDPGVPRLLFTFIGYVKPGTRDRLSLRETRLFARYDSHVAKHGRINPATRPGSIISLRFMVREHCVHNNAEHAAYFI